MRGAEASYRRLRVARRAASATEACSMDRVTHRFPLVLGAASVAWPQALAPGLGTATDDTGSD
jgi:hypothetical protein